MTTETKEFKAFQSAEFKATESDGKMRFEGYLANFDNVDSYGDVIIKGAFGATLAEKKSEGLNFPVLEQHGGWGANSSDNTPIGYYEDLWEDDKGLYVKGVLFPTERGKDIYTLLKTAPKGFMGQSIGYSAQAMEWTNEGNVDEKGCRRKLTKLKLFEGSIVTFPANDKARVDDVKSEAMLARNMEKFLKTNGFSTSEATKIAGIMKKFAFNAAPYEVPQQGVQADPQVEPKTETPKSEEQNAEQEDKETTKKCLDDFKDFIAKQKAEQALDEFRKSMKNISA